MEQAPVPYQRILFVCTNQRENNEACCADRGSAAILEALKSRIKALNLTRHIRVAKSGCHDVCAKGPSVMMFPDHVWYAGVTSDDVERIIQHAIRDIQPNTAAV
jgi:(2Fe-2S) ferredoxin